MLTRGLCKQLCCGKIVEGGWLDAKAQRQGAQQGTIVSRIVKIPRHEKRNGGEMTNAIKSDGKQKGSLVQCYVE